MNLLKDLLDHFLTFPNSLVENVVSKGVEMEGTIDAFPVLIRTGQPPHHESLPFTVFKELKCSIHDNGISSSFTKGL